MGRMERRDRGICFVECLIALGVLAILLSLAFVMTRGMRKEAELCCAENNLKQISVGLELYFGKHGAYPPHGCDLAEALKPFISDPRVFDNPFGGELTRGECLTLMYIQPSLATLDSPSKYLTAFVKPEGTQAIALLTNGEVRRLANLESGRGNYGAQAAAVLAALEPPDGTPASEQANPDGVGGAASAAARRRKDLGEIKYICVKSTDTAGSGLTYQGTWKRLAGNSQIDPSSGEVIQKAMDTFEIGIKSTSREDVVAAAFNASIHAGDKIFRLPGNPDNLDPDTRQPRPWTVGELIAATDPDLPTCTGPIQLLTTDPNPMSGGWEIELDEYDSETGDATFTLKCKFGLGVDNDDKFHQLTRINLSVVGNGATISAIGNGVVGNKYYATRNEY